ncbi:Predicted transcriptional regulator YheO, contains PAS and DNA-binding HTH domains [Lentzea fradiae]|uniref:Predicted transcriptional regulator YheO, contains PAS and DNA-binding HTH domains n=1 Tax=Lentzea fradiae TaxID=200378 RepID=A0A1G7UIF3_9PSEU|nr:aminotransferase class V-fold PLP-dependent enzyme [Lentzea fradiae]SDG47031.1 Predicted transcriptional regulator YheO, contains PAS and DNA-binding HTH domains [Lentzea fradiae]
MIDASYLSQFREPEGYLDFARFGPPSLPVVTATARLMDQASLAGPATVDTLMREEQRVKAAVARLCRTDTDHVALVPNTSTGLFQAAFGLTGTVMYSAAEFPSNTYPWVRAGLPSVLLDGPVTPSAVSSRVSEVSALSVSAVDFRTGHRADLAGLREAVGDRLLIVDGIQGFGVVDEPWELADVLVVGGQKWLRAGWGTGFVVLSDRALDRLSPVLSGWTGAVDAGLFDNEVHDAAPDAAAWNITNLSPVVSGAFAEALELVELAGVPALDSAVGALVAELEDIVLSCGGEIVSARDRRAGILAFTMPHAAPVVGEALNAFGVTATVRPEHVRLSPHATTSRGTLERVRAALRSLSGTAASPVPAALSALVPTVDSLASALGPDTEVVVHDLSRLPNSIIAIAGTLTGRQVGGPMTDLLLGLVRRGTTTDMPGYETYAPDGRAIWSSTTFVRDASGVAIGCLCVNKLAAHEASGPVESFPQDVDTLQRVLVEKAVADVGVPVELMKKVHKSQVVRVLDEAGFFLIRDSVDHLAGVLGVTRYTIYNYLNESRGTGQTTAASER